jgi:hypothetical protein
VGKQGRSERHRCPDAELTPACALCAFGNWCVERGRIAANPFNRPPKRDEKADRRRERRALTEDELRRLLKVARLRPIAEYGRKVVKHADAANRANKRSRRTWSRAPLAFDDLEAATARGRDALRDRPDFIRELERRGRERQLVYKTLTLTGLRKGELTALRVRHAELDGPTPYLVLDAADEKAGRGAEIPLRGDLANDLRKWLADRLDDLRNAARDDGTPLPAKLPPDMPLLDVPSGLIRILDRDLVAAGIARLVTDNAGANTDRQARRSRAHGRCSRPAAYVRDSPKPRGRSTAHGATGFAPRLDRTYDADLHRPEIARRSGGTGRATVDAARRFAAFTTAKGERNRLDSARIEARARSRR